MRQASILLIEDEALIRLMVADMVESFGHRVVAVAGNVSEGCTLAQIEDYDCAILDINLMGFNVRPVAEAIRARGLPFLFPTGYGPKGVPDGFEDAATLHKPCSSDVLRQTIESILPDGQKISVNRK